MEQDWNEIIEEVAINDFCKEIIAHNHYCQHCQHCNDNICIFAYACLTRDFYYFNEGD